MTAKKVITGGLFALAAAIIAGHFGLKVTKEQNFSNEIIAEQDRKNVLERMEFEKGESEWKEKTAAAEKAREVCLNEYSNFVDKYKHRTAVLDLADTEFWDTNQIVENIKTNCPPALHIAALDLYNASSVARMSRNTDENKNWTENPNAPYSVWDKKKKSLIEVRARMHSGPR